MHAHLNTTFYFMCMGSVRIHNEAHKLSRPAGTKLTTQISDILFIYFINNSVKINKTALRSRFIQLIFRNGNRIKCALNLRGW